jgi:glutathione S-transferase
MGKVPFLRIEEKSWNVPESSIIIEYIERHYPGGTKLIPDDPDLARQVRMRDRFFDFYVNDPMVKIFFDGFPPGRTERSLGRSAGPRIASITGFRDDRSRDGE